MYQRRSNPRWILFLVLAVAAIAAALTGLYLYFYNSSSSIYYYSPPYFGWWLGWPFFRFGWLFIPLIFFLIFFGLRWIFWRGCGWARGCWYYRQYYDPALEILRERFAKGEITKEQFDDMVRNLKENWGGKNKIWSKIIYAVNQTMRLYFHCIWFRFSLNVLLIRTLRTASVWWAMDKRNRKEVATATAWLYSSTAPFVTRGVISIYGEGESLILSIMLPLR